MTNDTAWTRPSWMTARLRVGNGPGRCLIMGASSGTGELLWLMALVFYASRYGYDDQV